MMATNATLRMIQTAHDAGCPKDQLLNFAQGEYCPLPWQFKFHSLARQADSEDGPDKIGVGGARGGAKSHAVFAQVTLDDCQRIPKLKALFLRQTGTAAQESFEDLINRILLGKISYQYIGNTLHFPNGSRVLLGGFYREQDVTKYVGIEYDLMAVEELNQLTQRKVDLLLGSMRTSKPNWRPRLYSSFNPGGPGHQAVKNTFVTPYYENRQQRTRFIPATYKDNPYLNKGYIEYLEGLEGDLGRAWREGSFDLFEGQAFEEWQREKHVVTQFDYPLDTCTRIIGFDWGYRDKGVASWLAFTPENRWGVRRCYLYRQLVLTKTEPEAWAEKLATYASVDPVKYMVMPHDTFAHKESHTTIAQIFETALKPYRIPIVRADSRSGSRLNRKAVLHMYLADAPDGKPYFQVLNNCTDFIESIPTLQYDENRPEDIAPGDDHCLRYDTKVLTTKGYQQIGDLVGEEGYLVSNGSIEHYHNVRKTGTAVIYELKFSNGVIVHASSEHPFLTDRGWIAAIDLRPADRIQCVNESQGNIRNKTNIQWYKLLPHGKLLQAYKQKIQRLLDITQDSLVFSQWAYSSKYGSTSQRHKSKQQPDCQPRVINQRTTFSRTRQKESQQSRMDGQETQAHVGSSYAKSESMAQIRKRSQMAHQALSRNEGQVPYDIRKKTYKQKLSDVWKSIYSSCKSCEMVFKAVFKTSRERSQIKLISRTIQDREAVYNLEVDNTHCFAIQSGIIVHNSFDSATYSLSKYAESNPGFIVKSSVQQKQDKAWSIGNKGQVQTGNDIIKEMEEAMKHNSNRNWQS